LEGGEKGGTVWDLERYGSEAGAGEKTRITSILVGKEGQLRHGRFEKGGGLQSCADKEWPNIGY